MGCYAYNNYYKSIGHPIHCHNGHLNKCGYTTLMLLINRASNMSLQWTEGVYFNGIGYILIENTVCVLIFGF